MKAGNPKASLPSGCGSFSVLRRPWSGRQGTLRPSAFHAPAHKSGRPPFGVVPLLLLLLLLLGCAGGGDIVRVTRLENGGLTGLGEGDRARLEEIRKAKEAGGNHAGLADIIEETPHYTAARYLKAYPEARGASEDYIVGGNDVLCITVYEEPDLSREAVRVSGDGYISFPLIGRLRVAGLSTSDMEKLISNRLAREKYLLDAHVSVMVTAYNSRHYLVLGAVKNPGSHPLRARERVLDAVSQVEGLDPEKASNRAMIVRTLDPDTPRERKVVIEINLADLLRRGDQVANLPMADKDVLYVPPAEHFYIIGQVKSPGSYSMPESEVTLVEAIGMAGGFTPIASRNKTRIVRMEDGIEKIIEVKVDQITRAGKKIHDVTVKPDDIIVVPESFF